MSNTHQAIQFATARLSTGPRLHYAEKGSAGDEPMVFVHGWPDSWFSFSRVLADLPTGYRALACDQRGFGNSERPKDGYSVDHLAEDLVAFLDAVRLSRVSLVGHSAGSFVARRVAERHPERVERLVLIGSALTAVNQVTRQLQAALTDLPDPIPVAFVRELQQTHVPLPRPFMDEIVAESCKLPARLWPTVVDAILEFEDVADLQLIGAPTLILWGEQDPLFPHEQQQRLLAAIPDARLLTYVETGHCPHWERPEQVVADLDDFMRHT